MEKESFVRITVLVITYKQETVIGRALDSILCQKEYGLKEIIICDDCSPDNNWQVIQSYKKKYPNFIRAYRNNPNKGIYANIAYSYSLVEDTDYIVKCSGDDALYDGFFESFQHAIKEKMIDIHSSNVVYGDYMIVDPNSNTRIVKNNAVELFPKENAIDLKMKKQLSVRSTFISYNCFKRFDKFPLDKGVAMSEVFCDLQVSLHSDYNYYIPVVGSVYYSDIGVSTKMKDSQSLQERINAWRTVLDVYNFKRSTICYVNHEIFVLEFFSEPKISYFLKTWWYFINAGQSISVYHLKVFVNMVFRLLHLK